MQVLPDNGMLPTRFSVDVDENLPLAALCAGG
jgi:hypothetical protein